MTVVTVHVDDVNDHSPTFTFPNLVNNTVHVTSSAVSTTSPAPGHLLIAVCQATDADDGPNARLTYEIVNVSSSFSSSDQFRLGRTSGRLTMRVGRAETVSGSGPSENTTFAIAVRARDDGWPSLSSTATLYVVVVTTASIYDDHYWRSFTEPASGTSNTQHNHRSVFYTHFLTFDNRL